MDWSVDASRRAPRRSCWLDPGLELIDVTGSGVDGYQAEALGSTTRVLVRLASEAAGQHPVSVRALARVPAEGTWTVPAARPLMRLWTGGSDLCAPRCEPDPGGVPRAGWAADCRPGRRAGRSEAPGLRGPRGPAGRRAGLRQAGGRRLAPRSGAGSCWAARLHGWSARSPGESIVATCSASRSTCRPTWVPDRVRIAGVDEPVDWHPEVLPDGERPGPRGPPRRVGPTAVPRS